MKFQNKKLQHFKNSINNEHIISLNFDYLSPFVEIWWAAHNRSTPLHIAKFQLISLILENCNEQHRHYFDKLGTPGISAVCVNNIFKNDCPQLSLVVHEALSELFALTDIKYPYEEHKNLYLKPGGEYYKDWGNGYGEITPHSDDLYEDIDADFLSLTVCRDQTKTPTVFYFPKDILHNFTDAELLRLLKLKAKFISGKNVGILKTRERHVIELNEKQGYKFHLDFRVDTDIGERMLPLNYQDKLLLDKMRANIATCPYKESTPKTGSFLIVANHKILHARGQMRMDRRLASKLAKKSDFFSTPRLLYRSKGQDAKLTHNRLGA
jgi:hypothetical protein